jgi:WD40 repeat protein
VDLASAVNGVSWCPSDSTIFASVTDDGRIEIWDLMHSTLDPVISHFPTKSASQVPSTSGEGDPVELSHANLVNEAFACTKVTFAPTAPVIVVGDSTGEVSVYRVPTLIDGRCDGFSLEELVLRLQNAINPNSNE